MKIEIKYDKKADTIYLYFSDETAAYSKELDKERIVAYSEHGEITGIKFLSASSGVKTDDLPHRSAIERAFNNKGMTKLTQRGAGRLAGDVHKDAVNSSELPRIGQMKARLITLTRTSITVLFFIGFLAASVLLSRNLFVLNSLTGLVASILGLVVALFPVVLGCLILLAWALWTHSQTSRP